MAKQQPQHGGKRAGAGRPRKYATSDRVTVVVPHDLLSKIDRAAEKRGIKRSEAIVEALRRAFG